LNSGAAALVRGPSAKSNFSFLCQCFQRIKKIEKNSEQAVKFLNGRIVHCKWSEVEVTTLSGKPQKAIEVSEVSYFFALVL
jgi:hypothetical protein